jgi:ribose transport system substrate-binding protein
VVATLSGNSQQEQGYKVMKDILAANPDVSGVFSCNDPMAVGAAQALKDAGKSGSKDIFVIGFNADQIALDAIKNGDMAATIQQVPVEMGKKTVDLATKLMNGEKLIYDNAAAREIFVPVNLITPETLGVVAKPVTKKVIGFSVYDMQYGFFQDMEKGTHEAATAAGYDYILVDEKSSESTMVSATIDLINQGISALIISPFKPDALGPIVDAAKAKGIPVVVDDIGGGGSNYDAIVISNNEEGGTMAAVQMDKLISAAGKPKKVASITCEASAVYAARRNVGFETKIKALGYTVVATLSGNSQQEQGYKVMKDILSANPDVSGVFSCNDPMAVGAAQAIKDAGKSGSKDIFVIGFNADQIALDAIKNGDMAATIQQVPVEMGKMTVDLATKLMNGEKLTYDNADAREIFVPVNLITIDNLPK